MALPAPAVAAGKAATSNIRMADIAKIFRFIFYSPHIDSTGNIGGKLRNIGSHASFHKTKTAEK
jgi:hypothetical protein